MFKFLKDKLKSWTEKIASAPQEEESATPIPEESKPEIKEEIVEEKSEKKQRSPEKKETSQKPKKEKVEKKHEEEISKDVEIIEGTKPQDDKIIEEELKEFVAELEEPKPLEEIHIDTKEETKHEKKEGFISKLFKKKKEIQVEESRTTVADEEEKIFPSPVVEPEKPKTSAASILQKVKEKVTFSKITITQETFDNYAVDLQELLLENNVAYDVAERIIKDLSVVLVGKEISRKDINEEINDALKDIVREILIEPFDLIEKIKSKKEQVPSVPFIIMFCGINGSGKTTSIAKLTNYLKENKFSCVLAAGDTFRAASIEQLKFHGEKLDVKVVAQEYGHDPAAVAYDAVAFAKKHAIDVVLIDTAGRMHTEKNLMNEIEKIGRVVKPDLKIFVGESITGNDATEQAKSFNYHVGIDGIILSKSDIDEKGGTALSVGYITKKPILFLGVGQNYTDIEKFDKEKFIERLGL